MGFGRSEKGQGQMPECSNGEDGIVGPICPRSLVESGRVLAQRLLMEKQGVWEPVSVRGMVGSIHGPDPFALARCGASLRLSLWFLTILSNRVGSLAHPLRQ
jgi:hypothetical protein